MIPHDNYIILPDFFNFLSCFNEYLLAFNFLYDSNNADTADNKNIPITIFNIIPTLPKKYIPRGTINADPINVLLKFVLLSSYCSASFIVSEYKFLI